jgi:hypothetical protein
MQKTDDEEDSFTDQTDSNKHLVLNDPKYRQATMMVQLK